MWWENFIIMPWGLKAGLPAKNRPISRLDANQLEAWLPPRRPTSNKGDHGKLVIIGGDHGTAGAIRMTGDKPRCVREPAWSEC